MRWLSERNATNLGLMKNTGAECQQWGLSTIPKRIFESPDVPCIEFDSTVFILAEAFKKLSYQVIYSIQRVLYTTEISGVLVLRQCTSIMNTGFINTQIFHKRNYMSGQKGLNLQVLYLRTI